MTLEELTTEKVLDETMKLQYFYRLKYEIRYGQNREDEDSTESVAEHVFGMHILATYFLPLEDPEHAWNWQYVYEMITLHDLDEVETGDTIGYLKTPEQRAREAEAMQVVINKSPLHMQQWMSERVKQYEALDTPEAKFTKAIDRFEPLVHLYSEHGRRTMHTNQTTVEHSRSLKTTYVAPFPFIRQFSEVLQTVMAEKGYFWSDT